jgi:cobalamin biosynthetic protein CobC
VLEHGGRLRAAAEQFAAFGDWTLADWLDLSTGINPHAYPVPAIDRRCWQRLPEDDDGLDAAAAAYYGSERLLALPGSQAAIQLLPALFAPLAVACMTPIYEEHPQAWQRAGHRVRRLENVALAARPRRGDADDRALQPQQPDRQALAGRRAARCGTAVAAARWLAGG